MINTSVRRKRPETQYDKPTRITISTIGDLTTGLIVDGVGKVISIEHDRMMLKTSIRKEGDQTVCLAALFIGNSTLDML